MLWYLGSLLWLFVVPAKTAQSLSAGTNWRISSSYLALKNDGSLVGWGGIGGVPSDLDLSSGVKTVSSNPKAFAILKNNGDVVAYGEESNGGVIPSDVDVSDVVSVTPSGGDSNRHIKKGNGAFCALKSNEEVVAWGDEEYGGSAPSGLKNVKSVHATVGAFAVLTSLDPDNPSNLTAVSWGSADAGGVIPEETVVSDVVEVFVNPYAFACLLSNGSVSSFGVRGYGGGLSAVYSDVITISGAWYAFAALTKYGRVYTWGNDHNGGSFDFFTTDIYSIYSNYYSFTAMRATGELYTWGVASRGGAQEFIGDPRGLVGDAFVVYSTMQAYTILLRAGTIATYGANLYGGCTSDSRGEKHKCAKDSLRTVGNVVSITSSFDCFSAIMKDGSAYTWGSLAGGASSSVPESLTSVVLIASNKYSFAAISNDGSVAVWGGEDYGGVFPSNVGATITNVLMVFGSTTNYADSSSTAHFYPCPHGTYGPGFPNCTACPSGSTQPPGRPGILSDVGSCKACPTGETSYDGLTCANCRNGTVNYYGYNPYFGSQHCLPCFPGEYAQAGAVQCAPCEAGTFSVKRGQGVCEKCAVGRYARQGAASCAACAANYTVYLGEGVDSVSCFRFCAAGFFGTAEGCTPCPSGQYNGLPGQRICQLCAPGKSQLITGSTACEKCAPGKFSAVGGPICFNCPAGSFSTAVGSVDSSKCAQCPAGKYGNQGATACTTCPAGTYSNSSGSASYVFCPAGTFQGSTGSTECNPCPQGQYSPQSGAALCSSCGFDEYNTESGLVACEKCDEGQEANEERSGCVDVTVLAQETFIETLFNNGIALYGTAIIAACFVAIAGILHFKREREDLLGEVGRLSKLETLIKSILPGASFGSEVFLIAGEFEAAQSVAGATLAFRLLHAVAGMLIISTLFSGAGPLIDNHFPSWKSAALKQRYDEKFSLANLPFVTAIALLSLFDVTMVQFLPWRQSPFFEKSKGYPTLLLLKLCMTIKIVQSVGSVAAQISYLSSSATLVSATASPLARGMIIFNIIVAILGAVLGLLLFLVKRNLLALVAAAEDAMGTGKDIRDLELTDIHTSSDGGTDREGSLAVITNPMYVLKLESSVKTQSAQIEQQNQRIATLELQVFQQEQDHYQQEHYQQEHYQQEHYQQEHYQQGQQQQGQQEYL